MRLLARGGEAVDTSLRRRHRLVVTENIRAPSTRRSAPQEVKTAYDKSLKATILVDGTGRTLYLLTSDPANTSTCAALAPRCTTTWPGLVIWYVVSPNGTAVRK